MKMRTPYDLTRASRLKSGLIVPMLLFLVPLWAIGIFLEGLGWRLVNLTESVQGWLTDWAGWQ